MARDVINNDLYVSGNLQMGSITLPNDSIGNNNVTPSNPIAPPNIVTQFCRGVNQNYGAIAVTQRTVVHVAVNPGTVAQFQAGLVAICAGAATVTVDLHKNGTTILSAVITLTDLQTDYDSYLATFTLATYNIGDVFEIVITATAGGGTLGQGLFTQATFQEQT